MFDIIFDTVGSCLSSDTVGYGKGCKMVSSSFRCLVAARGSGDLMETKWRPSLWHATISMFTCPCLRDSCMYRGECTEVTIIAYSCACLHIYKVYIKQAGLEFQHTQGLFKIPTISTYAKIPYISCS